MLQVDSTGSSPCSDPECWGPGPPSACLAPSPIYIPGAGVHGQARGMESATREGTLMD